MADKPESLGKSIVKWLGGILVMIAIVQVTMYFLTQPPPPPADTRQLSFEPKEFTLDKGHSQVVRLQIGNPPEEEFPVFVEALPELGLRARSILRMSGQKEYDLKVEAKDDTKAGTYVIKAGNATCKVTVR
jgi:hypothetical protein